MQSKVHGSVDNEKRPVPTPQDVANFSDRKSTRLNSSHSQISYAVFCLKKKICQVAPEGRPTQPIGSLGQGAIETLPSESRYHSECSVREHSRLVWSRCRE